MEKLETLRPQGKKKLLMCLITGKARGSTAAHLYSITSKILHRKEKSQTTALHLLKKTYCLPMPKPKIHSLRKMTTLLLNKAAWFMASFMSAQVKRQTLMLRLGVIFNPVINSHDISLISIVSNTVDIQRKQMETFSRDFLSKKKTCQKRSDRCLKLCLQSNARDLKTPISHEILPKPNDWKIKIAPNDLSCCFTLDTPRDCQ